MKKILSIFIAGLCVLSMTACNKTTETTTENTKQTTEAVLEKDDIKGDSQVADTGKAILVVSFGTSYNDSREKTIGAIEEKIRTDFPDYAVRRAFTSEIIIKKLKERDGLEIDNVTEAMNRLKEDGFKEVIVQPTHVMSGIEYDEMKELAAPFEDSFEKLAYGMPLLPNDASEEDFSETVNAIMAEIPEASQEDTAIVFMGHGTEAESNATYLKIGAALKANGYNNAFVGTVESTPTFEDVLKEVNDCGAGKVILYPLMIVAGDHANNDMAGDEEESWKTMFKKEGFEVVPVLKGLGEYTGIREIYSKHVKAAAEG